MTFVLTFLTSTWYIKNPFLKSKINDVRIQLAAIHHSASSYSSNPLGALHEYLGIRARAQWHFGQYVELASNGFEASHACIDAFLYWFVFEKSSFDRLITHAIVIQRWNKRVLARSSMINSVSDNPFLLKSSDRRLFPFRCQVRII